MDLDGYGLDLKIWIFCPPYNLWCWWVAL